MRRLVLLLALALVVPAAAAATPRDEARVLAAATRAAIHDVNAFRAPFRASVLADRRKRGCGIRFPERVSADGYALDRLRTLHAVDDPLRRALDAFAARLSAAAPRDPVLGRGVRAWLRALAPLPPQPTCAALRRWAHRGFRSAERPYEVRATEAASVDRNQAIVPTLDAAARLRRLGIPSPLARRFAVSDLRADLESAVPPGPRRNAFGGYESASPRVLLLSFSKGAEALGRPVVHEAARRVTVSLTVREPPPYDASGEPVVLSAYAVAGCVSVRLRAPLRGRTVIDGFAHRRLRRQDCPGRS